MIRLIPIFLSVLLALGQFSDKFLPFVKEGIIGLLFCVVLFSKKYQSILFQKTKESAGLFLIFFVFLLYGVFMPYHVNGESVVNVKFLIAILFFVVLSTFFAANTKFIKISLISFGVGAGLLSIFYAMGLFGSNVYEIRNDRLILLGENPNSLSVRISLGVLFLVWGFIENDLKLSKIFRVLLLVPIPFMFNLILISGSKGSFLLCIASVTVYIMLLKNVSVVVKRFSIVFGALITFGAFTFFFQSALYERFLNSNLTTGRADIWSAALNIFTENPFGVGEIGYQVEILRRIGKVIDTHNIFIYLLVCGGVLCLVLFFYFLYKLLVINVKRYRIEKNMIYLTILFSMIFVMSKTGGVLYYLIMWYFLACINVQSAQFNKQKTLVK